MLKMKVVIKDGSGNTVSILNASDSAARSTQSSQQITKTLTVNWSGASDGVYSYGVSGTIVQTHLNKKDPKAVLQETVKATSNTLVGSSTVDGTAPTFFGETPAGGSLINYGQAVVGIGYSDNLSGIDISTVQMFVDGALVSASVSETDASFATGTLSEGLHSVAMQLADLAGKPHTATVCRAGHVESRIDSFPIRTSLPPSVKGDF